MIPIDHFPAYWRARAAERRRKWDNHWDFDTAADYEEIANHLSARKPLDTCPAYARVSAAKGVIIYSLPPPTIEGEYHER